MENLNTSEEVPMKDTSNILVFPKKKISNPFDTGPVQTEEDVKDRVEAVKHIHIDSVLDAIVETIIQQLMVGGFDTDEDDSKYIAFVAESLRALMCFNYNIFHPLQSVMDEAMVENDEGVYLLAENIEIHVDNEEKDIDELIEEDSSRTLLVIE
jgi:hypothetical protein